MLPLILCIISLYLTFSNANKSSQSNSGTNQRYIRGLQTIEDDLVQSIPTGIAESVLESVTREVLWDCDHNPYLWECVRFSKVEFPNNYKNAYPETYLPLSSDDYPIRGDKSLMLKDSMCPSVMCVDDPGPTEKDINNLIAAVGGAPTHPSCHENNPFWLEFEEVVDFALIKKFNVSTPACIFMELPDLWVDYTLEDAAAAVHNEFPGKHQALLIEDLLPNMKVDENIIPMLSEIELVRGVFMLADLNTWAVSRVGADNFLAKWYVGRARPEEVAYKLHMEPKHRKGERICAPCRIKEKIDALDLQSATDFTSYPEGSPMHPSWPAMHSAGSSLSLWLPVVCNLSKEQLHQAKLIDYAVAYGRTVAGVHYHEDNIAGLNMGQEIIANALPGLLHERYGSDIEAVKAKIDMYRFDWREFEPKPGCWI